MPSSELSIGQALDLGTQFAMAGNHKSAEQLFRGVLMHEPENFEAIERLGSALFEMKQYHEALYWFWRGRKIDRKHPLALTNYGLCVSQLGHTEEGIVDLERAVARSAKMENLSDAAKALIFNNLGNALERLHRHKEALVALDTGLTFNPKDSFARYNRGIVLLRLNRHQEAIAELTRALEIDPQDYDALYNRSMAYLLTGDLASGFRDYEARLRTTENELPELGLPIDRKWDGSSLEGKRILVHAEQGLGDEIQFFRSIPPLQALGPAEVVMISHKPLRDFARAIPGVRVLDTGEDLDKAYDVWVAQMSLPRLLGIESEAQLPAPYLPPAVEPERIERWRDELRLRSGALNIAVCWAGQWTHKNNAHRSIPLATFAKLFDAPCNFVSVQQMCAADAGELAKLKGAHRNLQALYLEDFRDTAAVLANLDLVITADTSIAHFAASMGLPTWILIPAYGTDWRWQLGRTDSPWYPSAKLYRQSKIGDWAGVIARLVDDLTRMAASDRAA